MRRRLLIAAAILVGLVITGLLVTASIWPVLNTVETGQTPEYPELQPHYYTAEPRRVFDETADAIDSLQRWRLVQKEPSRWTLTAQRSTQVFGFVDDIEVTIEPVTEFVTRVSVLSRSRFGKGDFGQNARNIAELQAELDRRLGAVKFDPDSFRDADASSDEAPDTLR